MFFQTGSRAGIQPKHAARLNRMLTLLHVAVEPEEMRVNGWDCHKVQGSLEGCWASKVNGNWRLVFRFDGSDAVLVDYSDYRQEEHGMMHHPSHPGLLIADILEHGELKIERSVTALARHIGVTRVSLSRVLHGKVAVSARMAIRLEAALGVKADVWLRLQTQRDLWQALQQPGPAIDSVIVDKAA